MYVAHLSLTDFRSYAGLELALEPGVTSLVGRNGQGKTNLVEAIGYAATLSSHRVSSDAPLVRLGAERSIVRVAVVREERSTLVELEITPGKANRARINRGPVPRAREVLGLLRTVLFAPEDLALVKGDPGERRRFLDDLLAARAPRFAAVRADYERVLKQRTALLKSAGSAIRRGQGDVRTLDVWDAHLATAGAELLAGRLRLVDDLAGPVGNEGDELAPRAAIGRLPCIDQVADHLRNLEIAPLRATADIISLAEFPPRGDEPERAHVIADIEPIAHVLASSIDGERLALQRVQGHQRNELLRELELAVIVRAVADHGRKPIGAAPGAHQMIGGGFAGGVGRTRIVAAGLSEAAGIERTEHFIR